MEQEALLKANEEHISVGHAKRLLAKLSKYSDVVKSNLPNINPASQIEKNKPVLAPKPKMQSKPSNLEPKPQRNTKRTMNLTSSQLEIYPAPDASSSEASQPSCVRASPAPAGGGSSGSSS